MANPRVSLTMIVRDVAEIVAPCLESVASGIDEAVIVDTGSRDATLDVVSAILGRSSIPFQIVDFSPAVHPEAFLLDTPELCAALGLDGAPSGINMLADYSAARQAGWDRCTGDYVLWLDSDDLLVGADRVKDVAAKLKEKNLGGAYIDYEYVRDGLGKPALVLVRERLAVRASRWQQPIHEVLVAPGSIERFDDFRVVHRRQDVRIPPQPAHRNLKILLHHMGTEKIAGRTVDPRVLFYAAQEIKDVDPIRGADLLREYVGSSGWSEERARAHLWLGQLSENAGRHDQAFTDYAACVAEKPDNPDGHFGLMRVCYHKQRFVEAAAHGMRGRQLVKDGVVELLPFNPVERVRQPPKFLSMCLVKAGLMNEALEVTQEGLEADPGDTNLRHNLAWLKDNGARMPERSGGILASAPPRALAEVAAEIQKRITNPDQARAFISSLPEDVRRHIERTEHTEHKNIVIWTGHAWEPWGPHSIDSDGIGGSETAAVHLARELANLGYRVTLAGEWRGQDRGVAYQRYDAPLPADIDVLIVSRQAWVINKIPARQKLLWIHDIHCGEDSMDLRVAFGECSHVVALSEWHRGFLRQTYPDLAADKIAIRRNAVDPARFAPEISAISKKNVAIYASSPDRGLVRLLDLWPHIRRLVPDAELRVYYGFSTWEKMGHSPDVIRDLREKIWSTPGVEYKGRVGQVELAEAYIEAKVLAYPTWFSETSCIAAMEAQAAGCIPVTTRLAALSETVHTGTLLEPPNTDERYGLEFVTRVVSLFQSDDDRRIASGAARTRQHALGGWAEAARGWTELFRGA